VRLALLSDQHANDVAFRAALEAVERVGVEEIVCLGYVAQGGAEPVQTLDRLASLGCETVLGNADALLLEVPVDSPEPITERHLEVRRMEMSQPNSGRCRARPRTCRPQRGEAAGLTRTNGPRSGAPSSRP
jgi:hypothetical protein